MKILLTMNIPYFPGLGGANKANRILMEALANRHCIQVVVPALGTPSQWTHAQFIHELTARGVYVTSDDGVDVFNLDGVKVHAVVEPACLRAHLVQQIHRFKPDWILVSSEDPSQTLLEAAIKINSSKVAYIVHTPGLLPFGPQSLFPSARRTELLKEVTAIIAVSKFTEKYIRQWSGLESTVIYMPVYGSGPFPNFGRFDEGFITMVNPCGMKGISIFLALAQELPEIEFAGVPGWGTTAADRITLEGMPNVHLLEPCLDFDKILARSRVVLTPSLCQESFSLTVVEAMLHGIPTLTSSIGGLKEAKMGTGFILPVRPIEHFTDQLDSNMIPIPIIPDQDIAPWRDALCRLLSDRALYERESVISRELSLRFVSSLGVKPLEDLLNRLASGSKANRNQLSGGIKDQGLPGATPNKANQSEILCDLTPEQQALLILRLRKKANARTEQSLTESSLVPIQANGSKPPFFCVHELTGSVRSYFNLARHLGSDQPVYGLRPPDSDDDHDSHITLERMAAHYIEALRVVQSKGPYHLIGWSYGGLLAFEMAQQLQEQGQQVALLVLLDTIKAIPGIVDAVIGDEAGLLASLASMNNLPVTAGELRQLEPNERLRYILERAKKIDNLALFRKIFHIIKANLRASANYIPKVYPNQITLFRSSEVPTENFSEEVLKLYNDPALGWGELSCEPIEIHIFPGNHFTLLAEPNVQLVAESLNACLNGARVTGSHR